MIDDHEAESDIPEGARPVLDPVVDIRTTPMLNDDDFKIVLLSLNKSRGTTLTHAAETLRVTWPESKRIAQAAEAAGMDAILSVASWRNTTPSYPTYDRVWESLTFTAGLAAVTERIQLFATVHVPLFHPVMLAKMMATADHIAGGRLALNVVAGWNQDAFDMFGLPEVDHDRRYEHASEWMELLLKIFAVDEPFDFDGEFVHGKGIVSQPKPLQRPRPVIMSAGSSPEGLAFAGRYADVIFAIFSSMEEFPKTLESSRRLAAQHGNERLKFCGHGYVVCADTEREAQQHFEHLMTEQLDKKAAGAFLDNSAGKLRSVDVVARENIVRRTAAGSWGFPLVGTPDQIADSIATMHAGGMDGMAISFPDYDAGVAAYDEAIRPLLVEAGVRSR